MSGITILFVYDSILSLACFIVIYYGTRLKVVPWILIKHLMVAVAIGGALGAGYSYLAYNDSWEYTEYTTFRQFLLQMIIRGVLISLAALGAYYTVSALLIDVLASSKKAILSGFTKKLVFKAGLEIKGERSRKVLFLRIPQSK